MSQKKKPDKPQRSPGDADSETFLGRWSRLKTTGGDTGSADLAEVPETLPEDASSGQEPAPELKDEDMPEVETIGEDSDVSAFLSAGVSEGLRRKALRKLFTGAKFNIRDGLDDYDDDFRTFTPLGGIMTADMRHHAERKIEALKKAAEERLASLGEPDAGATRDAGAIEAETGEAPAEESGGVDPADSHNEEPRNV